MILVDAARWPWRGRLWAHLVSDHSVDELHRFAHAVGKRRVGFQGDHYDVDLSERSVAIELGAEVVDSRVLVRRLRDSGLRMRGGLPKWDVLHDGPSTVPVAALARASIGHQALADRLATAVDLLPAPQQVQVVLLERHGQAAAMVRVPAPLSSAPTSVSSLVDHVVDEVWVHDEGDHHLVELLHSVRLP
jgi:hypothetical protein